MLLGLTVFCVLAGQTGIEVTSGMILPGSPESNTPSVAMDYRVRTALSPAWSLFLSASFWSAEEFNPTGPPPDFTGIPSVFGYQAYSEYSDSHRGMQLGAGREVGPVILEAALGRYCRTITTHLPGAGKSGIEYDYSKKGFLASFSVAVPAGEYGILRAGVRSEGFDDWFMTVSAGIGFDILGSRGGVQ